MSYGKQGPPIPPEVLEKFKDAFEPGQPRSRPTPSRLAADHELKTWPEPYQAVVAGEKRHEVRVADRDFTPGDLIELREWDPTTGQFTGRSERFRIGYLSRGPEWGLPVGLVVFSLVAP